MNQHLQHYRIGVQHPEVSGFEHLNLLLVRDTLAAEEHQLSAEEKRQLIAADRRLLKHAAAFHTELARITDLAEERRRRNVSPEHWWWYLDVVRVLPLSSSSISTAATA